LRECTEGLKEKRGHGNCCKIKQRVGEGRRRGKVTGWSNKRDSKRGDKYRMIKQSLCS
jgi:hypothetical protein